MDKLSKEKVASRLNIENYAIKPTRRKIIAKKVIDIQQKEYIKQKFLGKDSFTAAIAAGYPKEIAKVAEQRIETFAVKETMANILDKIGLSDEDLAQDIIQGLRESTKLENGEKVPDYSIRHKYLTTALTLKDQLGGSKKQEKEPIQILIVDYDANKDKPAP